MNGRCKNCKWWEFDAVRGWRTYGICSHPFNGDGSEPPSGFGLWQIDMIGSRPDAMAAVETGPEFGCVHFEPK